MAYFSTLGMVKECRLMIDKNTSKLWDRDIPKNLEKFRGFAFIRYSTEEETAKVLSQTHYILDTKVELKRALTKESTRNKLIDEKFRKMFLYGLKKNIS